MKRLWFILLLMSQCIIAHNVGLLIVATGKYIKFVERLLQSADEHFCVEHDVTYFVFTDQEIDFAHKVNRPIIRIEQKRLGWPYDTLMRIPAYLKSASFYEDCDYLFALDADMLFVDTVGSEILSELVATQHPGYVGRRGTYETRKISTACVGPHEGTQYFAGGFNGGSKGACLKMYKTISKNIGIDLDKKFIALWHDESHINRYFIDHTPTLILSPSYCYPGRKRIPFKPKLIALDKNHKEFRS